MSNDSHKRPQSELVLRCSAANASEISDETFNCNHGSGILSQYKIHKTMGDSVRVSGNSDSESSAEDSRDMDKMQTMIMMINRESFRSKRLVVSAEDAALIAEFGRAVTCPGSKECWVARKGKESIFHAFMLILNQV
jgi:hypothetical protein